MNNSYVFSSELFSLFLALFQLFLMLTTRPKITALYKICFRGVITTIILLGLEFYIGITLSYFKDFNELHIKIAMCVFDGFYLFILNLIIRYIVSLDESKRIRSTLKNILDMVFAILYMAGSVYLSFTGKFCVKTDSGYDISLFTRYFIFVGLLCALFAFVVSFLNRNSLSRIVNSYILIFIPLEIFVLIIQMMVPNHIITGITYAFPFLVFYVLFHSNPFDDTTGCQNLFSFEARFSSFLEKNINYSVIFVSIPKMEDLDFFKFVGNARIARKVFAETCRKAEHIAPFITIYRLRKNIFAIIFKRKNEAQTRRVIEKLEAILRNSCTKVANRVYFRMIAFNESDYIQSEQQLFKMVNFLDAKFEDNSESQVHIATPEDYQAFRRRYQIETLLYKIRNGMDLYDERVLLYVQPIYDVRSNSFRTGEALMRLKDDEGNMIPPNEFIPIAEQSGCIHSLTRIILNKVCSEVSRIKDSYDFDAITVNFSSAEFNDKNLYKEILQTIKSHDIPTSYIRIELTESAMFDSYETVKSNLEILRHQGINFYLDDFGTGYSNLERIMSLPFYAIKFDKSLLYKSLSDITMEKLVSNMIVLFQEKGFHSLCEGIEDDTQNNFCVSHGIEYIQGFKYAKPVPVEKFTEYLSKK